MPSCAVHCVGMMHVDPSYRFSEDHMYSFVAEPDNRYDPNAIMVVRRDQDGRHVGYLAREFAQHIGPILHVIQSITFDAENSNTYKKVFHVHF